MTNFVLKETTDYLLKNKDRIDHIRLYFNLNLAYIGNIFQIDGKILLLAGKDKFMIDLQEISWEAYDRICSLSITKS